MPWKRTDAFTINCTCRGTGAKEAGPRSTPLSYSQTGLLRAEGYELREGRTCNGAGKTEVLLLKYDSSRSRESKPHGSACQDLPLT